jgi:outer membrane biosynthesis protein TonB
VFGKLLLVVATCGLLGAWLLALRQERVQVSSEIARAQLRVNKQDETLWILRARIARQVTPREVERLSANLGPLHPILPGHASGTTLYATNITPTPGSTAPVIRTVSAPAAKPNNKPASKPVVQTKPQSKPAAKPPTAKPAAKPAAKPTDKKATTPKPPVKRPPPKPAPARLATRPTDRE